MKNLLPKRVKTTYNKMLKIGMGGKPLTFRCAGKSGIENEPHDAAVPLKNRNGIKSLLEYYLTEFML